MVGPCADKVVKCTLVHPDGHHFVGRNECDNPQAACPRSPGEDYQKCKTVCQQAGHAEEQALAKAEDWAAGCKAYIEGINFICRSCQEQLLTAGVTTFIFGKPPLYTGFPSKEKIDARLFITD